MALPNLDELLTKVDARISGECGRYNWSGRDLRLEAKIDRATGVLDTHLAGWATDFTRSTSFGRVSRAGG